MPRFYPHLLAVFFFLTNSPLRANEPCDPSAWLFSRYCWGTDCIFGGVAQNMIYKFSVGPASRERADLCGFNFVRETSSLYEKHPTSPYLVLFFHGTGGNSLTKPNRIDPLREVSSVLLYEYTTMGPDFVTNGVTLSKDAELGWDQALELVEGDPSRIIIFGRSLGSGVAITSLKYALQKGQVPGGLLIEAGYDAFLPTMGDTQAIIPYLLPNHDVNSIEILASLKEEQDELPSLEKFKIAQIILTEDTVIKPERQNRLADSLWSLVPEGNFRDFSVPMGHIPADDASEETLKPWLDAKRSAWFYILGEETSIPPKL